MSAAFSIIHRNIATKLIYNKSSNLTKARPLAQTGFVTDSFRLSFLKCFVSSEFSFEKSQIEEIINL